MKRLALGSAPPGNATWPAWVENSLREIERASAEDIESVVAEFKVTGTFTPTRTLDCDTAELSDLMNFIATLVTDIKRGGQKKSYGA